MKFISHRGNVDGIAKEKENTVEHILSAINQGFDVEIDVWYLNNSFFLGHDEPKNEIHLAFLRLYSKFLWCHAKDVKTLNELLKYSDINCFFHQNDESTLTSKKQIWSHIDNKVLTSRSIFLIFEKIDDIMMPKNIFGICSDYIEFYKNKYYE